MKRLAAHYVYAGRIYPMSFLSVDSDGMCVGICPLKEEIHSTIFMDGVLMLVPTLQSPAWQEIKDACLCTRPTLSYSELLSVLSDKLPFTFQMGTDYSLWHLRLSPFSATKLSTDNGSSNGYVQ